MKKIILQRVTVRYGFSLMELMIVIVIIGILAAGSLIIFGDKSESAKIAIAKKNHTELSKYLALEAQSCLLGRDKILNGEITCSAISNKLNSGGNPAGDISRAFVRAMAGEVKNPYGANYPPLGDDAVTTSGWGNDRDLGYIRVDPRCCGSPPRATININTCYKLPCNGNRWNNTNPNVKVSLIIFYP